MISYYLNTYEERMLIMNEEERIVLPANVKQIGSISGDNPIYMEDYACTYLQQYASSDGGREKAAILVGKKCNVDNKEVLFISVFIFLTLSLRLRACTGLSSVPITVNLLPKSPVSLEPVIGPKQSPVSLSVPMHSTTGVISFGSLAEISSDRESMGFLS